MSKDRFRIRDVARHRHKDYDEEMTRRGLWHSTMAGGVASIWGRMSEGRKGGASVSYPNKTQIRTYARFSEGRFTEGLIRDDTITDSFCLREREGTRYVLYREDTRSIRLDLPRALTCLEAVAVDTTQHYAEIDLGRLPPKKQVVDLPRRSDWAIALRPR
jgi:hypothetical protein